jgi:hypothetical protein
MMRKALVAVAVLSAVLWAANPSATTQDNSSLTLARPGSVAANSDATDAITIPRMLSYQGKLLDNIGNPVVDTLYAIRFTLYTQPTGGSPFWSEDQSVNTRAGLFSVVLGSVTPIGTLPDAGALYLGMKVGADPEMTPRLRIVSAAYAYLTERAANADLLQGRDTATFSRSNHNHDAAYVNEGQADAVTSTMVVNGTIAAVDLGQMGAANGQVMKWNGSTWVAANDSIGLPGGSGTVTSVSQATGIVCAPNPITSTGTVRFDTVWGGGRYAALGHVHAAYEETANKNVANGYCGLDASTKVPNSRLYTGTGNGLDADLLDGSHASDFAPSSGSANYIQNQFASYQSASWRVLGQGKCSTSTTNAPAIWGINTASQGIGVRGYGPNSGWGVAGYSDTTSIAGIGVMGRARNIAIYGKSEYNSGVYGHALDDDGVYGYGQGLTLFHYAGVYGQAGSDSTYGVKGTATMHPGVFGQNSSTRYGAVEGRNLSTSFGSAAVAGFGDTVNTAAFGVYGLARYYGVYGRSKYYNGVRGEASDDNGVSGYYNGTNTSYAGVWGGCGSYGYGVYYSGGLSGSGTKNCVMRTSKGPAALYCQESPENWFEDFGSGTLVNGRTHVELDALFLETVTVDAQHPIKVFVQQTSGEPVNFVVQKGGTGFDVVGPSGSAVSFDYRVVAKRKGFEDLRLNVVDAGYNDPVLYPDPNDPQIPAGIRAKRLATARLMDANGNFIQPSPSNPTTVKKVNPMDPLVPVR